MTVETITNLTKNTWIGDSGSTGHLTNELTGLNNIRDVCIPITVGDGATITATKIGDWKGIALQPNGKQTKVTLKDVRYCAELKTKLISITTAI